MIRTPTRTQAQESVQPASEGPESVTGPRLGDSDSEPSAASDSVVSRHGHGDHMILLRGPA